MRDGKRKRQRKNERSTLMTLFESRTLATQSSVNRWSFQLCEPIYIPYVICLGWGPVIWTLKNPKVYRVKES